MKSSLYVPLVWEHSPGGLRCGLYFRGGTREHWARKQSQDTQSGPGSLGADKPASGMEVPYTIPVGAQR